MNKRQWLGFIVGLAISLSAGFFVMDYAGTADHYRTPASLTLADWSVLVVSIVLVLVGVYISILAGDKTKPSKWKYKQYKERK